MKRSLLALACLLWALPASALNYTGVITKLHLNRNVTDRGVCFRMGDSIPTSTGWACIFNPTQHLYDQMTSMVLTAHATGHTCKFWWDQENTAGHAIVYILECDS